MSKSGKGKEDGAEVPVKREMFEALKNISQHPYMTSSVRSKKDSQCSILIIDDDYEYLLILSRYMARPGLSIEIESDWWEAVNKHCLSQFDLIISDLNMPKYNGRDVFDYVHKYLTNVHMIFITALDREGIRTFLPDYIYKSYPIISKSQGISDVRKQIQKEIDVILEAKVSGKKRWVKKNG